MEKYRVVRYGQWWYGILNTETNIILRVGPNPNYDGPLDDKENKLLLFKSKDKAQEYIDTNLLEEKLIQSSSKQRLTENSKEDKLTTYYQVWTKGPTDKQPKFQDEYEYLSDLIDACKTEMYDGKQVRVLEVKEDESGNIIGKREEILLYSDDQIGRINTDAFDVATPQETANLFGKKVYSKKDNKVYEPSLDESTIKVGDSLTEGIYGYYTYVQTKPGMKQPDKTLTYGGNLVFYRSPYSREKVGRDWKRHIGKIIEWSHTNNPSLFRMTFDYRSKNYKDNLDSEDAYIAAIQNMIDNGQIELIESLKEGSKQLTKDIIELKIDEDDAVCELVHSEYSNLYKDVFEKAGLKTVSVDDWFYVIGDKDTIENIYNNLDFFEPPTFLSDSGIKELIKKINSK